MSMWLGSALLAVAGLIIGGLMLAGPGRVGPAHRLVAPQRLGSYVQRPQLARQLGVGQLEKNIVAESSGEASRLVSAVYQDGSATSGGPPPKVMLFVGAHLSGASAEASVKSFIRRSGHAWLTSPGRLGGEAACVSGGPAGTGAPAVCAWFDNDTFGELVSPDMSASALAKEMRAVRPSIERLSR